MAPAKSTVGRKSGPKTPNKGRGKVTTKQKPGTSETVEDEEQEPSSAEVQIDEEPGRRKNNSRAVKNPKVSEEQLRLEKIQNSKLVQKGNMRTEGEMSDDPAVQKRQCTVCFLIFANIEKLKRHMKSHTDQAEAMCTLCGLDIKYKYNLKNHVKTCQMKMLTFTKPPISSKPYEKFVKDCKKASVDLCYPLPSLKGTLFKMDKYGHITGFDDNLEIDLRKLIPNYRKEAINIITIPEDDDEDD